MVSSQTLSATVSPDEAGLRADLYLARRFPEVSRARFKALIAKGHVRVEGRSLADPSLHLKAGQSIEADIPPPEPALPQARAIPLDVVYEDAHCIVIDKPPGLVVHPAAGHRDDTLVNALIAHCGKSLSGINGVERPGIVHRLDKDTSGLLVAAKTDAAHRGLSRQFAAHGRDGRLERAYLAIVWGVPERRKGMIEAGLARGTANRQKIAVSRGARARHAVTHYEVKESFGAASLIECRLETGRTHQIRVHLAHASHPLLGDATYGKGFMSSTRRLAPKARDALAVLGRQALHAAFLGFEHPVTGKKLRFVSKPPADFAALLAALRESSSPRQGRGGGPIPKEWGR
jgi:23S rRNA pseudouridine1911/1915/1917 synthase